MLQKNDPIEVLRNKIDTNQTTFGMYCQLDKKIVTFLNCYSYLFFRKKANIYKDFDSIYCDGIILQKLVRTIGVNTQRVSFDMTSLAPVLFDFAEKGNYTIAIVGSEESNLDAAINNIQKRYPKLNFIEKRSGFFANEVERESYIKKLTCLKPDIVIVGMGTPLQDFFLTDLKKEGWEGLGYTCGGFIHQTASKGVKYYPKFIDKYNLRWLYRIYDEPKLLKRYAFYYPLSLLFFIYDAVSYKLKSR
ncbi:WecB/TagA/CpsF family glycosyltransferase [Pluralibacter gergoviae]